MGFRAAGHGYRVHMLQFLKGGPAPSRTCAASTTPSPRSRVLLRERRPLRLARLPRRERGRRARGPCERRLDRARNSFRPAPTPTSRRRGMPTGRQRRGSICSSSTKFSTPRPRPRRSGGRDWAHRSQARRPRTRLRAGRAAELLPTMRTLSRESQGETPNRRRSGRAEGHGVLSVPASKRGTYRSASRASTISRAASTWSSATASSVLSTCDRMWSTVASRSVARPQRGLPRNVGGDGLRLPEPAAGRTFDRPLPRLREVFVEDGVVRRSRTNFGRPRQRTLDEPLMFQAAPDRRNGPPSSSRGPRATLARAPSPPGSVACSTTAACRSRRSRPRT